LLTKQQKTKKKKQYVTREQLCCGGKLSQLYSGVYTVRIPAETPIILRYFVFYLSHSR